MTEAMKNFLQKLAEDKGLLDSLKDCKTPEETFKVASGAVEGLNFEEFMDIMGKVNDFVGKSQGGQGELSDDDLEQVAGGWSEGDTVAVVTSTVGAVGAAVDPAAAAV